MKEQTMELEKYTAAYFSTTKEILAKEKPDNVIIMQFFQRKDDCILGGINDVLALLEASTDTSKYSIKYLPEGSKINNLDIVLELEGHYHDFGLWEGVIDGILSRYSSIASNAARCVRAARGKEIIFMGDRADHYINQEIDGKAARLGGIKLVSTLAQKTSDLVVDENLFGSMPHVLIQGFKGDVVAAAKAFLKTFPNRKLIALVDYNNNVIQDSLKLWNTLGNKVWGVRVDTSKNMSDHMFDHQKPQYGVNPEQITRLRNVLDQAGAKQWKIVVSSGFNETKIKEFEELHVPVDYYGVGQSIFKLTHTFSADATFLNGNPEAKEGRKYRFNPKLIKYQK
ncbi:nicotinate phosphoribosyltransferase [Mycoplasmopsis bovirhinis]|uniref:nicotinate phosphoribosyltransferase n=1 Tax=Mycoplasmopsis bovirhinis TaxID=29553 RepID=UPI002286F5D0